MNCMKCRRETRGENVFCQDCLREMARYPVHPATVVLLPRRKETVILKKPPKRHVVPLEDKMKSLQKTLRILIIALAVCIALIVLMFKPTMHYILDEHVEIGQNYSTVTNQHLEDQTSNK